jgi:carbamoyl-phosphate synthase large subunit
MKRFNVLLTAGSRRVPLVHAFRNALRATSTWGSVIVTDVNPLSPAVHVADRSYRVPYASEEGYLEELLAICEAENVGLAVPTIDDELPIFGAARDAFRAIGVVTGCSPEATSVLCNDKYATCSRLLAAGVPAARTYLPAQLTDGMTLPLFIKPRSGRGAVGAFPIHTYEQLDFFLHYVDSPIVQEYLSGPEFTIDVLCDFSGRPLSIVPRERVVIRAGVIDRGRTVNDRRLIALAERVCEAILFAGPLNIQCRMRGDQPVVFEINPRFSGGIPLTIQSGADFPEMLLRLAMGRKVAPAIGAFRSDLWMTSFESSFFLDGETLALSSLREPEGEQAPGAAAPLARTSLATVREVA